jgi:hypothetical protein
MNEATPLNWIWFTGAKGTVGIVRVLTSNREIEYRIGAVDGFMEKMDVLQLVAWGAKFPYDAGQALMGEICPSASTVAVGTVQSKKAAKTRGTVGNGVSGNAKTAK